MLTDLRFALRQLVKAPGFTLVAVCTLALGIGSATAMFSAIYQIILRPLPFPDAAQLVTVRSSVEGQGGQAFPFAFNASGPDYLDWAAQNRCFAHLAAAAWGQAALLGSDAPRQLTALGITANYFDVFGRPPTLGRTFSAAEAAAADGSQVILSHAFWTEAFLADPGVIGRTLKLESGPCTIVGVAAPQMDYRQDIRPQIYVPLNFPSIAHRSQRMLWTFGRLKPEVTVAQAGAEMDGLARQLQTAYPDTNQNWGIRILPLQDVLTRSVRRPLVLLYAATVAILLLACVNLATLMLVRATGRLQEVAIRAALGASRLQLIRQLLTESLLVAALGGLLGVLLAQWGVDLTAGLARQLGAGGIEGATDIALSGPVLGFALVGTCGATLLLGIYPALHLSKTPLESALRTIGRGLTAARSRQRVLRTLVVAQVTLAFVLMAGAGLLTRSLLRLQQASPGFQPAGLLAAQLTRPNSTRQQSNQVQAGFADAVIARLNALPGVTGATVVNVLPFTGYNYAQTVIIEGRPAPTGIFMAAELRTVNPSYHRVLGMPVLRGRGLSDADDGNHPVVVIDEPFARRFFGSDDPLGHRLILGGQSTEIVGLVGPVKDRGLGETDLLPHFYIPLAQNCETQLSFIVRTAQDPSTLAGAVQRAVAEVDPQQPVERIALLADLANRTVAPQRLSATLISALAGFSLLLSALGVYGVMAYSVAQRTREIAIRMALGALTADVLKNVLRHGVALAGIGVGLGVIASFALHRLLASFLFEISPFDLVSFAGALVLLLGAATFSCWLPAWRATKVDPIVALRAE